MLRFPAQRLICFAAGGGKMRGVRGQVGPLDIPGRCLNQRTRSEVVLRLGAEPISNSESSVAQVPSVLALPFPFSALLTYELRLPDQGCLPQIPYCASPGGLVCVF